MDALEQPTVQVRFGNELRDWPAVPVDVDVSTIEEEAHNIVRDWIPQPDIHFRFTRTGTEWRADKV